MEDCIFCKIVEGSFSSSKVYEDEDLLAFMDIQPVNEGHVLIIPKKHIEKAAHLDEKLSGKIFALAGKINKALMKSEIKPEGINYFLADGEAAGQEVFHAHFHIIPRFRNDGFGLYFPEGYKNKPEKEKLDKAAEKIKRVL